MTAMTYTPIMICDHGDAGTVSFHAASAEAHAARCPSPAATRIATREEHAAAGWDVTSYPQSISC